MQYSVNINQVKSVEWELNGAQAALMAFVYDLESWGDDMVSDNQAYKWISKQKVIDELPLFFTKPNTVQINLLALEKKGLVKRNSTNQRSLVKITQKGKEWRLTSTQKSELVGVEKITSGCEINHRVGVKNITAGCEINHTDPTTIDPTTSNPKDISKKSPIPKKYQTLDFSPLKLTDEQIVEYIKLRGNKVITDRVIKNLAPELEKARQFGYSNEQILDFWSDRGWAKFDFSWMQNALNSASNPHNQTQGHHRHGQASQAPELNGIAYGEHADQSIFPVHLRIASNDMPAIKKSRTATQRSYIEHYGPNVQSGSGESMGTVNHDVREPLELDEWRTAEHRVGELPNFTDGQTD
ncbi:hypothetical protein AB4306_18485 [Vibrio splendidus]